MIQWSGGPAEAGRIVGSLWFGEPYVARRRVRINAGLCGVHRHTAFELEFGGDERDLGIHVGLWWVSLFVSLCGLFSNEFRSRVYQRAKARAEGRRGVYAYELDPFQGRTTGIRVFGGSVWIDLWNSGDSWRDEDTPRLVRRRTERGGPRRWTWIRGHLPWNCSGWSWTIPVVAWLIGDTTIETDPTFERVEDLVVRMPEGDYPAIARVERVRWNRRWWRGRWYYRANVDVPAGIPHDGKGENAHDCDEDATYGISFGIESRPPELFEAANRVAIEVLKTRQRRGGLRWAPSAGFRIAVPDLSPELAVLRDLLLSGGWDEGDANALVRHASEPEDRGGLRRRAWDQNHHTELRRLLRDAAGFEPVIVTEGRA